MLVNNLKFLIKLNFWKVTKIIERKYARKEVALLILVEFILQLHESYALHYSMSLHMN